jgi:hypothetical protein
MRPSRLLLRRSIGAASIVVVFLALVVWMIRPSLIATWLDAVGLSHNIAPLSTLQNWAGGQFAPMTPIGFITLFTAEDLGTLVAMVVALAILLILLPALWRNRRTESWLTRPLPRFRLTRVEMRVRTAMALIAILGIELGWEIVAWRNWSLSQRYAARAATCSEWEANYRASIRRNELDLVLLEADNSVRPGDIYTPGARVAVRNYFRDRLHRESEFASREADYYAELGRKYRRAAADPTGPIPADLILPGEHQPTNPWSVKGSGNHAQDLAGCDELIRCYSDLPWAHKQRAWILATCPDSKLRDGKIAVAAATRAAELTNWKESDVLRTLAAAYAETGDFTNALRWERRGVELEKESLKNFLPRDRGLKGPGVVEDRLALYMARKPLRMAR